MAVDEPSRTSDELDQLKAQLSRLEQENQRLLADLAEQTAQRALAESAHQLQTRTGKWLARQGLKFTVGTDLYKSLLALIGALRTRDHFPDREIAWVTAAAIRRWIRVGLFTLIGGIVALATLALLIWQNVLIRQQISQQQEVWTSSRRTELLNILYSQPEECAYDDEVLCPHAFNLRTRTNALIAYYQLEKQAGTVVQPDISGDPVDRTYIVDLTSVDLSFAFLDGVELAHAKLTNADFSYAYLIGANLQATDLRASSLQNAILIGADLEESEIGGNLDGANLSEAILVGARLRGASTNNTSFRDANLKGSLLSLSDFSGTDFIGANLSFANMRASNFINASFAGASLRGANVSGADFSYTSLQGADFRVVNFNDPQQYGPITLEGAYYSPSTKWPAGFDPQEWGAILVPDVTPGHWAPRPDLPAYLQAPTSVPTNTPTAVPTETSVHSPLRTPTSAPRTVSTLTPADSVDSPNAVATTTTPTAP